MADDLRSRIGRNVRLLRAARGLTQAQMARLSAVPRATWSHIESGGGNPTLEVLAKVAGALQVPIEELIAAPRALGRFYPKGTLTTSQRGDVTLRSLLPDKVPGMVMERMELPPGSHLTGIPHMPGTREYLVCEKGSIVLRAAGEKWTLREGDAVAFRGDQRHSYQNPESRTAVGYSVVILAPAASP